MSSLAVRGLLLFCLAAAWAAVVVGEEHASGKGGSRIVAVADLHGDWEHAVDILRAAGLAEVDESDASAVGGDGLPYGQYRGVRWTGGEATLVQTGDIVDRGDFARDLYKLFSELRRQAKAAGGRVVNIVGNHELLNLQRDLRYVSPGDNAAFGGAAKRKQAWTESGDIGRQILEEFEPLEVVGETLFVHAGLMPKHAEGGLGQLKDKARQALRAAATGRRDAGVDGQLLQSSGPFWVRRFAEGHESSVCPLLLETLRLVGAKRMVVGHTQVEEGRIRPRCDGQLLMADTIISKNGYPMCWGESSRSRRECEGSRSFIEFQGSSVPRAVRVIGTGADLRLEHDLLPNGSRSNPISEL